MYTKYILEIKDSFIPDWSVDISQIMVAVFAFIAVIQFFYTKRRDRVIASVDEIRFFRTEIIPAYEKFLTQLRGSLGKSDFVLPKIASISNFNTESIKTQGGTVVKEQIDSIRVGLEKDYNTLENLYLDVVNKLEEFSLRVIYLEINNHDAMNCVIDTYIAIVESTITYLLIVRVRSGKNTFTGVEKLYHIWKGLADRRTQEERLQDIKSLK